MTSPIRISRRALLVGAPIVGLSAFASSRAHADLVPHGAGPSTTTVHVGSRVVRVATDVRGVTATLELEHAPFPAAGAGYADPTVLVFIPHHHRVARDAGVRHTPPKRQRERVTI